MITVRTPENSWVQIDPMTDTPLYRMTRNVVNVGADYAQGEDLYTHVKPEKTIYYIISWVAWQRTSKESYRIVSIEEAKKFILDISRKAGKIGLDPDVSDRIEKHFPGLLTKKK